MDKELFITHIIYSYDVAIVTPKLQATGLSSGGLMNFPRVRKLWVARLELESARALYQTEE